jgi:hypothetical protein
LEREDYGERGLEDEGHAERGEERGEERECIRA